MAVNWAECIFVRSAYERSSAVFHTPLIQLPVDDVIDLLNFVDSLRFKNIGGVWKM